MKGRLNTTGVKESDGTFELIPEGEHTFEIVEIAMSVTKNSDPMAKLTITVKDGQYKGQKVWDNIVIPYPTSPSIKILGRTKHFLHCIGEEYEGDFEWDSDRWVLKTVVANIRHEKITEGKYAGKDKAVVANYVFNEALATLSDDPFKD